MASGGKFLPPVLSAAPNITSPVSITNDVQSCHCHPHYGFNLVIDLSFKCIDVDASIISPYVSRHGVTIYANVNPHITLLSENCQGDGYDGSTGPDHLSY